ncbi:DsbE family thiol:disulfide interchange protein [Thalassotalea ganghwensis]
MNKLIRILPLIVVIALGSVLYLSLFNDPQKLPSALVGQPMPKFSLPQLSDENKQLTEQDLTGEIVLLNVWGSWCWACTQEHPFLVDIAKDKRITLYGINYKDERSDALQWLNDYKDPFVFSIFDRLGRLGIDLGVYGAPETFVIDHQGIIRMRHAGPIDGMVWKEKFEPMISILEAERMGEKS